MNDNFSDNFSQGEEEPATSDIICTKLSCPRTQEQEMSLSILKTFSDKSLTFPIVCRRKKQVLSFENPI